jgi:hypothetical protein
MLQSLTIAIATMGDRIETIQIPDPTDGVQYYIGVQKPGDIPKHLEDRADVKIEKLSTVGLSRSRNAAISACETDLLLIADDDLIFSLEGIDSLRQEFDRDEDLSIATGRLKKPDGMLFKNYPNDKKVLTRKNSGFVGSPEIMIRVSSLLKSDLRFDEEFGLGTQHPTGEEYIFITDAMNKNLVVSFFPITVATHPEISTGSNWKDVKLIHARSKVLGRVWGKLGPVIRIAYAMKKRKLLGTKKALRFALGQS